MRDIRNLNIVSGQKIESDEVLKKIGDFAYRNLGIFGKMSLYDEGKALILDGLRVTTGTTGGMTILLEQGTVFQRSDVDVLPALQTSDIEITLDAASGLSRIDIVEAQVADAEDRDDLGQVATIVSGTVAINPEAFKRDIKYYVNARKKTNTTLSTSGTAGVLTGTVDCTTVDLSAQYLINIADGEDGSFQEIDCRGAIPDATTGAEIVNIINTIVGRTMASIGSGGIILLTGNGTGHKSKFVIKPPATDPNKDALKIVFGLEDISNYKYTYQGLDPWFKLAEIDIGAATTVITSSMIRNVDQKSTWANEADDIIVKNKIYDEIIDHEDRIIDHETRIVDLEIIPARIDVLEKRMPAGIGFEYLKNGDPAVNGDRVLLRHGQVIIIANYQDLVTACYVGDANNATAPCFYKTSDAGGTTRSTSGTYFVLPDTRGLSLKGVGNATINTRTKTGPTALGAKQEDQFHEHFHLVRAKTGTGNTGATTAPYATSQAANFLAGTADANLSGPRIGIADTDGVNGTPRTGANTRDSSIGTNFGITY
jgi:hypothetical protein